MSMSLVVDLVGFFTSLADDSFTKKYKKQQYFLVFPIFRRKGLFSSIAYIVLTISL